MARVTKSIIEVSGAIGDRVIYTRFGKTYSRRRPTQIKDKKSEAQVRQRSRFAAAQHTASLLWSAIQRGLSKCAHDKGRVENNEFANLNMQRCFVDEGGKIRIDYPQLVLSSGNVCTVEFDRRGNLTADGLHVALPFDPCLGISHSSPDDVVHVYAVEFDVEVCELVASVERQTGKVEFDLPDLSDDPDCKKAPTFHLYAIVETAKTAHIPTLSPKEKRVEKRHRNIERKVSPTIYIGTVTIS